MKEHEKVTFMREAGYGGDAKWIPTKEPDRPYFRSYHINALYGFRSWVDLGIQWRDAQDDPGKLQEFVNDVLGETWEETLEKPDEHWLQSRAEQWELGYVHERIKLLTLGADIQKDRIEAQVTGWNENRESWVVQYYVFKGNPANPSSECWKRLDDVISQPFIRADGVELNILVSFIDAGYLESRVNAFCDQYVYSKTGVKGVYPVAGKKKRVTEAMWKSFKNTISTPRIEINDQKSKHEIYQNLKRKGYADSEGYQSGYCHFPQNLNIDYYKQLVSEEIIIERNKYGIEEVIIANTKQRRNEALDVYKLCLCGLYYAYIRSNEIKNEIRKRKRLKEEPLEWANFWRMFEGI